LRRFRISDFRFRIYIQDSRLKIQDFYMPYVYAYPRPALTVDALVVAREKGEWRLLLIRRGKAPFMNLWALPGGFVNMDEALEQACCRELEEETGLQCNKLEQFRVFDALDRDPRHRTISVVFYTILPQVSGVKGADDASEAGWFPLSELPDLAFDHREIIMEFQRRFLNLFNEGATIANLET
jgi:8-oxo-dGTP diphosphatase